MLHQCGMPTEQLSDTLYTRSLYRYLFGLMHLQHWSLEKAGPLMGRLESLGGLGAGRSFTWPGGFLGPVSSGSSL